ncbi:WecB/TagA/CpsF family glycosyltransferase [Nitrincola sp. A-D6]|uniref:WecB/TagA/CpsF family glycosyltransferase n=1 Tax=Nitrincola sp. A-D6 TaxID=1545442 RepID=UPI00068D3004|nr:WecB/TagA/CpsF family glycosyltransferase [Nitrincola sp. A-D6]
MSETTGFLKQYRFRQQWLLLGLPFDAVTLDQACDRVFAAIRERQRCFISTPNLNFVISARGDEVFSRSVMLSDLSLADGMPLIWASRWLRLPIPERVAGSSLFDELVSRSSESQPLRVFFFGGDPGVAEKASTILNDRSDHVVCCGFLDPGRGDIASMSTPDIIAQINAAEADFLVVSLGAKKGQAWIMHNLDALEVPVVSHLGAVVNFVAGTVRRAPLMWQKVGLEWLWRITEEPHLWKRYWNDGILAIKLFARLLPLRFKPGPSENGSVTTDYHTDTGMHLVLSGRPSHPEMERLYNFVNELLQDSSCVQLDVQHACVEDAEIAAFIKVLGTVCSTGGIKLKVLGESG